MLKKILSSESCQKCQICCGFDENDKWEIPLIFSECRAAVEEKTGCKLIPRGNEYVFDMQFEGDKVIFCPALGENGCTLGELKPYDCKIWPFRVNQLGEYRVITVSPVCNTVSSLPLNTLSEFVMENDFARKILQAANQHPDMIKPYINGYPIVYVEPKV